MVTQDLIDYIRKKQENGISKVQIEQSLTAKGWKKEDIEKGFYAYKLLISPEPKSFISKKKSSGFGKIFFIFLLLITISFAGYYLYSETSYLEYPIDTIQQLVKNLPFLKKPSDISPSNLPSPTPDVRVELTMEEWNDKINQKYADQQIDCSKRYDPSFSIVSDTFVTYTSPDYKYSINLPYNTLWGDDQNKIKEYEIIKDDIGNTFIYYNNPYTTEGCGLIRSGMQELPSTTREDRIDQINQKNASKSEEIITFGAITYEVISDLNYPVLKINTPNALFGIVVSYEVYLPSVTLVFSGPPISPSHDLITQLVSSIKEI